MRWRRSSARRPARSACARTSPPRTCRCCRRCRRQAPRDTIVCSAADFPSMIYLFRAQEALGYRLRRRSPPRRRQRGPRAHRRGHRRSHRARRRLARAVPLVVHPRPAPRSSSGPARVGAPVVLDLYQAAGIIPVDVSALGVDFAAGGCLKWLVRRTGQRVPLHAARSARVGPAALHRLGLASAAVRLRHRRLRAARRPAAHADGDAGDPGVLRRAARAPAAGRRSASTRIRATSRRADPAPARAGVDHHGFRTVASRDPARLAGTVAVDVPDARRRRPHAQRPRHRRGLPSRGRHPRRPARLQHAGGGRARDGRRWPRSCGRGTTCRTPRSSRQSSR